MMLDKDRELAEKVVMTFKDSLHAEARQHISDAEFDKLTMMIQEALSFEKRDIAESIEAMVRKLKADAKIPDISL